MSNEETFWVICFAVVFLFVLYNIARWLDREDSKTIISDINKEPVYMNGNIHKNVVYANDNILHNELVEILECKLVKNKYCDTIYDTIADYDIKLYFKNKSPKTIKYLTCICKPLNAVDDYIPLKYGDDSISIKHTGPTATNKIDGGFRLNCNFDLNLTRKIEIISIEIEYMDKTKVLIDEVGINDVVIDELN